MKTKFASMLILIGLMSFLTTSESRAVNISNTWTLPQPGFNVFYRYFQDRISWFEADAVCQFHHANLVTVENIEQFDAARTFLKDLNILDYVWIGVMRPSNAEQFSWTNSKPLPVSEGYWAEPWPIVETPLCAVIDPARDYRWHALSCGGPETAAFMCEMEIPEWALHCTEYPEITVQYMSDSGAVQLLRHCEDTLKEISCQGKMTQMMVYDELKCPEEQMEKPTIESGLVATTPTEEIQPKVIIKNPELMKMVLEEVFTTDKDVDSNHLDVSNAKEELEVVENKKTVQGKKDVAGKKRKSFQKMKKAKEIIDEPMMGDAPAEEVKDESTTSSSKDDGSSTDRERRDISRTTLDSSVKLADEEASSTTLAIEESTSVDPTTIPPTEPTLEPTMEPTTHATEEPVTKNIVQGHPLFHNHAVFKEPIQVDNNNSMLERKDVSNSDDHFIPPMLLVKTRFTAPKPTDAVTEEIKETTTSITQELNVTEIFESGTHETSIEESVTHESAAHEISASAIPTELVNVLDASELITEKPILVEKRNDPRLGLNIVTTTAQPTTTVAPVPASKVEESTTSVAVEESTTSVAVEESTTSVAIEESTTQVAIEESTTSVAIEESTTNEDASSPEVIESSAATVPTVSEAPADSPTESMPIFTQINVTVGSPIESSTVVPSLTTSEAPETSSHAITKPPKVWRNDISQSESHETSNTSAEPHHEEENNLNNEENFMRYKPNRHRSITNYEHHHGPAFSLGKILG